MGLGTTMTVDGAARALSALAAATTGTETDDVVDDLLEETDGHRGSLPPHATAILLAALGRQVAPMTRRDLIHLLADSVGPEAPASDRVIDAIAGQFDVARTDAFLGPEILHALSKISVRSPLARAALRNILVRVDTNDTRFLLVRAAKTLGSFAARGVDLDVGNQLEKWAESPDLAVQAEARMQSAIASLAETLRVESLNDLQDRLTISRRSLLAADTLEELRVDAARLLALVDVLEAYVAMRIGGDAAAVQIISERAARLRDLVVDPYLGAWPGYADGLDALAEHHLFRVTTAFLRLGETLSQAEEWIDLDAALVDTVAALRLMLMRRADDSDGALAAIRAVGENIGGRPLGPFLSRMVGRVRFARILARWEAKESVGDGRGVVAVLRPLYAAVESAERTGVQPSLPVDLDVDRVLRLAVDQPAVVATLCQALPSLLDRLREAGLDLSADGAELEAWRMPVDAPGLYGGDPAVDDTVRPLLHDIWARVAPRFPLDRWNRLRDVLVFLVQLARDVRSDLPAFMLAEKEGGLGLKAGEGDLQRYVFEELRRKYGRPALYESSGFSGGRADSGLQFEDFTLPIEVKAEHADVSRDGIRSSYVAQSDRYATDRDAVAVLLVLDLRSVELAGPKARGAKKGKKAGQALYALRDSFWIDALPEDSQVDTTHPTAVIVGLFPGNQPKPSSLTRYSRRPRRRTNK